MDNIKKSLIKITMLVFLVMSVFIQLGTTMASASIQNRALQKYDRNIIIKYKDDSKSDASIKSVMGRLKLSKLDMKKKFKHNKSELLELGDKDDINKTIAELKKDPNVLYAQPDYVIHSAGVPAPSDPRFNEQWGLDNFGQNGGAKGIDINALKAWDVTSGSAVTVVGVLDTGIDINHEDLKSNIYVNPNELSNNTIDDDSNGYVDDVNGWNFADKTNYVFNSSTEDAHGTEVAGIIAAASNDKGIVGASPNVKILPLKFMKGGSGYTSDAIEAIEYAKMMGIKIINCSFGSTDFNQALYDEMQNSGILFICSAGNTGTDTSKTPFYPASFNLPNVISVAAVDNAGSLAPFSNYGGNTEVAAPGSNILTTTPGDSYSSVSGTSFAAPFVTGIAALLAGNETSVSPEDIATRIKDSITPVTALKDKTTTGGIVNALSALNNTSAYTGTETTTESAITKTDNTVNPKLFAQAGVATNLLEQIHYGETGINPGSGNYSRTFNDMTIPSVGMDINIGRTYNSKSDATGLLGRGWSFSYQGYVVTDSTTGNKVVILPSGKSESFNTSLNALDSRDTLAQSGAGYILKTKDQISYLFDSYGYLISISDRNNNTTRIKIDDTTGKILGITDSAQRYISITYNTQNYIDTITDSMGRTVKYAYNTNKLLSTVTDPAGNIKRYNYDAQSYLNEYRDQGNNLLEYIAYDHVNGNKATQNTDEFGNAHTVTYDTTNKVATITDSNGRVVKKWYDSTMFTIKSQDPEGKLTTVAYNTDTSGNNKYGEEKTITDRNGNLTQYARDSVGNILTQTNQDNSTKVYTYDSMNNVTSEKDESGKYTFYVYDGNKKNLIKKVQPLNGTDVYVDGTSDVSKFAITTYTYYTPQDYMEGGLIKSITDPEGNVTSYVYDGNGNLITLTDPESKVSVYNNNPIGWRVSTLSPMQYRTDYTFDSNGNVEKVVQNNGETTRTTYDTSGRKTKEVSPNLYSSALDSISTHTYTGNAGYRYTYYPSGKVNTVTDPQNNTTTYTYDIYGNLSTETEPNGSIYSYMYDVMNRVVAQYFKDNVSASQVLLKEYSYAILANGTTQTSTTVHLNGTDNAITTSTSDYAGRVTGVQNPDNTTTSEVYNPNGTIATSTDEKGSITYYNYDGLNRVASKYVPFDTSLYTYYSYVYDKAGKVKEEHIGKTPLALNAVPLPSDSVIKYYDYYKNGKIKTVTDSAGEKTAYQYDGDGNISVQDVYTDATNKNTTEYVYNQVGKPVIMKKHVKDGDLYGNTFGSLNDVTANTYYNYDLDGNTKSITTPDNVTTTYTYDNMDRQLTVTKPCQDENGNVVNTVNTVTYNWDGKVLTSQDANGNTTNYSYTTRDFLQSVTDTKGGVTAYYYDQAGRKTVEVSPKNYVSTNTLANMSRTEYTYDLMSRVLNKADKYIDPSTSLWVTINTRSYKYDVKGNVVKELDAMGYDGATGTTLTDKINSGDGTDYTYNLNDKVVSMTDPASKDMGLSYTIKYSYDALGRKVTETNAAGVVTKYYYDDAGNVAKTTVSKTAGATEEVIDQKTYDLAGNVKTDIDGNGNTTSYTYNTFNKVQNVVNPGDVSIPSNTVNYQYDKSQNLKWKKDTYGTVNMYTYDNQSRVLTNIEQKQDGTQSITTSVKYDKNGNKRYVTDGNGVTTEYRYDEVNRKLSELVTVTDLNSNKVQHVTSYSYDANSNSLTVTDWRGNVSTNKYDPLNRIIEKDDAYGKAIEKVLYNDNSVQIKSYDALNNLTQYTYDKNNRLLSTIYPAGKTTSKSYDSVGNIKTKTDGKGNVITNGYDEFNNLISVVNAKNETATYTYDLNGNILTQTDGKGNVKTFTYNVIDKPLTKTDGITQSPSRTEKYTYYANGLLKTMLDKNGKTTTYTYDSHGNLLLQAVNSTSIAYFYDNNGNQLTMVDGTGTTTRTYDELNRVKTKIVPKFGTMAFLYDITSGMDTGCTAETSTDPKGNITTKIYDRVGRLLNVTADGKTTTYVYNDDGSQKSVTTAGVSSEEYTYDGNKRITGLTNKNSSGAAVDTYSYTYDNANNQVTKTDSKGLTKYEYDTLNRLSKVTEPTGKATTYTFDGAGNRSTQTITNGSNVDVTTYSYNDQNRLQNAVTVNADGSTSTITYTYDNNGNLTYTGNETTKVADSSQTTGSAIIVVGTDANPAGINVSYYQYDDLNQLNKATSNGQTDLYVYNGDGLRVEKNVSGKVTRYLYESDQVVLETDGTGAQTAKNVYGINLITRNASGQSAYYLYNGHADVTALVDTTGAAIATYYYDAFGNIVSQTGSFNNNITYAGYQYDGETGLYYLNSRMYDPVTARFLQEDDPSYGDPSDPLSLNLYTYCNNEPIMYNDPTGHNRSDVEDNAAQTIYGGHTTVLQVSATTSTKTGTTTTTISANSIGEVTKTVDTKDKNGNTVSVSVSSATTKDITAVVTTSTASTPTPTTRVTQPSAITIESSTTPIVSNNANVVKSKTQAELDAISSASTNKIAQAVVDDWIGKFAYLSQMETNYMISQGVNPQLAKIGGDLTAGEFGGALLGQTANGIKSLTNIATGVDSTSDFVFADGIGSAAGGSAKTVGKIIEVNPKEVNFCQSSINKAFDTPNGKVSIAKIVKQGSSQVDEFPPIKVANVKGQYVAIDGNSRLYVAIKTKAPTIKIEVVNDIDNLKDLASRLKNNGLKNLGTNKLPVPR